MFAFVRTYGCQQNVADGEKIKGILIDMGYELTDKKEKADFILFNTCAVREHAEDRVFGNVGALKHLKKKNPNLIIALCGCMMEQQQVSDKIKKSFPFVNLVFGTHSLDHLSDLISEVIDKNTRIFECDIKENEISENIPIKRDDKLKAYLSIMYGCDNFCSYCIVPYVRGRERSRKSENVLKEAKNIINLGYKDITLLGQNVNSYGKRLEENIHFPDLIKKISKINGDFWIRFMTSHPKDATKELFDVMASSDKICKHIHLPFQSGSNRILKEMNRKYTREQYIDIINYAREKMPDITITSDIIVGFPGETYEDFKETLSLIKEVGFTSLYTFIYSKRQGTKAAKMSDPIPYKQKNKWFHELLDVQKEMTEKYCSSMIGKKLKVLVEKESQKEGLLTARTEGNIVVEIEEDKDLIGNFINVQITNYNNWTLKGNII